MITKKWWVETAWPWIKENWWAVLLFPVALIVVILMAALALRSRTKILFPHEGADERAREEATVREKLLAKEKATLEAKLVETQDKYENLQVQFEDILNKELEDLRNDPEKLRELMLRVGPGQK